MRCVCNILVALKVWSMCVRFEDFLRSFITEKVVIVSESIRKAYSKKKKKKKIRA